MDSATLRDVGNIRISSFTEIPLHQGEGYKSRLICVKDHVTGNEISTKLHHIFHVYYCEIDKKLCGI